MMRVQWIHIRAEGTGRRVQLSIAITSGDLMRDWNILTGMRPGANKATSHGPRTLLLQQQAASISRMWPCAASLLVSSSSW
jgi:hypothetical protein